MKGTNYEVPHYAYKTGKIAVLFILYVFR